MGFFQNPHMTTHLAVGSNSLFGDKCIVLGGYKDSILFPGFLGFFLLDIAIRSTSKSYNLGLVQKVLVVLHWYRKIAELTDISIDYISWNSFALKHHYIVGFVDGTCQPYFKVVKIEIKHL